MEDRKCYVMDNKGHILLELKNYDELTMKVGDFLEIEEFSKSVNKNLTMVYEIKKVSFLTKAQTKVSEEEIPSICLTVQLSFQRNL